MRNPVQVNSKSGFICVRKNNIVDIWTVLFDEEKLTYGYLQYIFSLVFLNVKMACHNRTTPQRVGNADLLTTCNIVSAPYRSSVWQRVQSLTAHMLSYRYKIHLVCIWDQKYAFVFKKQKDGTITVSTEMEVRNWGCYIQWLQTGLRKALPAQYLK